MSVPTPDIEPARIVAGDTARWLRSLPDFPASAGWALVYTLVNAAQRYTFSSSASGADHLVNVSAATTAGWAPGSYGWRAQATLGADVFTIGEGRLEVASAFASAGDARSSAQRMLDAVDAVLEGRVADGVEAYTIGGRSITRMSVPDLLSLRSRLRVDVARELAAQRSAAGLAPAGRIMVRF